MATFVLGLNAYHGDAAAALFADGELVAAAEEERFRRIKHWAGFPEQAVRWCLAEAGITIAQVGHIATNADPRAHRWRKLRYVLARRPDARVLWQRLRARRQRGSLIDDLSRRFPTDHFVGVLHGVEHHLAHLASCFLVSPFERSAIVSVDGFGDFSSGAWGWGESARLSLDEHIFFPHSLGIFYQALTQFLGFGKYGDEYKVMGLAAYGRPTYVEALRQLVGDADGRYRLNLEYFRHDRERVEFEWNECEPAVGTLYGARLEDLLGPARRPDEPVGERHRNLAASVQAVYEERLFALLEVVHRRYGGETLCLSGGCAMNSLANGKIALRTPFKRLYVQAAAGDAGGAIGAAAVVANRLEARRPAPMTHAYLGPGFDRAQLETEIARSRTELETARCRLEWIDDEADLCRQVAGDVAQGSVVGWFQGRMEWGPRALGNRSILCDPRRADMKDILNLKIKRRESFRPFAPSVLREHVGAWFEQDGDVPFMMQVFMIREEKRAAIPAVTHVDGSGRLQTVSADANPRYHRLIAAFHAATGVPMILNTSFNENEPVVCHPREALDCFLRTKMDVLVLGDCRIVRPGAA